MYAFPVWVDGGIFLLRAFAVGLILILIEIWVDSMPDLYQPPWQVRDNTCEPRERDSECQGGRL